jgi:hypothetical protein
MLKEAMQTRKHPACWHTETDEGSHDPEMATDLIGHHDGIRALNSSAMVQHLSLYVRRQECHLQHVGACTEGV